VRLPALVQPGRTLAVEVSDGSGVRASVGAGDVTGDAADVPAGAMLGVDGEGATGSTQPPRIRPRVKNMQARDCTLDRIVIGPRSIKVELRGMSGRPPSMWLNRSVLIMDGEDRGYSDTHAQDGPTTVRHDALQSANSPTGRPLEEGSHQHDHMTPSAPLRDGA
jgi:hypothetical protein